MQDKKQKIQELKDISRKLIANNEKILNLQAIRDINLSSYNDIIKNPDDNPKNIRKESIDLSKELIKGMFNINSEKPNIPQISIEDEKKENDQQLIRLENGWMIKNPVGTNLNSCGYLASMGLIATIYCNDLLSTDKQKSDKAKIVLDALRTKLLEAKKYFGDNAKNPEIRNSWNLMFDNSINYLEKIVREEISPLEIFVRFFRTDFNEIKKGIGDLNGFAFLGRYLTQNYGDKMIHYDKKHEWHLNKILFDLKIVPEGAVSFEIDEKTGKILGQENIDYDLMQHKINLNEKNAHITPQISFEMLGEMALNHIAKFVEKQEGEKYDLNDRVNDRTNFVTKSLSKEIAIPNIISDLVLILKHILDEALLFVKGITFDLLAKTKIIDKVSYSLNIERRELDSLGFSKK